MFVNMLTPTIMGVIVLTLFNGAPVATLQVLEAWGLSALDA